MKYPVFFLGGIEFVVLPIPKFINSDFLYFISKDLITNGQFKSYLSENLYLSNSDRLEKISAYNFSCKSIFTNNDAFNHIAISQPVGELFNGVKWEGPFTPLNDRRFNKDKQPIVCTSYFDVLLFCSWLEELALKEEAEIQVLPTPPALWDYLARDYGSRLNPFFVQTSFNVRVEKEPQSTDSPAAVGTLSQPSNQYGINDMIGNVWEWCGRRAHTPSLSMDGPRVSVEVRGGGYMDNIKKTGFQLNSSQLTNGIRTRHSDLGFRVAGLINYKGIDKNYLKTIQDRSHMSQQFLLNLNNNYLNRIDFKNEFLTSSDEFKFSFANSSELQFFLAKLARKYREERSPFRKDLIILLNRARRIEADHNAGVVSYSDKSIEENKIIYRLLGIMDPRHG